MGKGRAWIMIVLVSGFLYCKKQWNLSVPDKKILSSNDAILRISSAKIRVGILGKYHLKNFSVKTGNALILAAEKAFQANNETIEFKLEKSILYVRPGKGKKFFQTSDVVLRPDSYFEIMWGEGNKRIYSGNLEIRPIQDELLVILEADTEYYVDRTMKAEFGELLTSITDKEKQREYREVAKTIVRSYMMAARSRHEKAGYDICDLSHCQVFPGGSPREATRGRDSSDLHNDGVYVLVNTERGLKKPLMAYYHSTCGGRLTGPSVYWPLDSTDRFFRSGEDSLSPGNHFCSDSPHSRWKTRVPRLTLEKVLNSRIKNLELVKKEGRATSIRYLDDRNIQNEVRIPLFLSLLGREIGWSAVKSNDFVVREHRDFFEFSGKGLGHGIGLCQWGAGKMAQNGSSFREILEFYYPGARIYRGEYSQ